MTEQKTLATVQSIVQAWLVANGYDGLFCDWCACLNEDLMPCCSDGSQDCRPGYKGPCNSGEHGYHIAATREEVESGECGVD